MDLLNPDVPFKLKDKNFKIYARNYAKPSSFIAKSANITNSYIAEGCVIKGIVKNSIISTGCVVKEGAEISDSIVMPNSVIEESANIKYAIIGEESTVCQNAKIGDKPEFYDESEWGISVVGKGKKIKKNGIVKVNEIV